MSQSAGIAYLEYFIPPTRVPIAAALRADGEVFSIAQLERYWKQTWFEPEFLWRFFNDQMKGSRMSNSVRSKAPHRAFAQASGNAHVHCAGEETSADLAVRVGKQIIEREPGIEKSIGAVIHYHATLNQDVFASTACRLQYELGLKNAFAFSINQKGGNASFMALKVACDMLAAEPDLNAILLVGSEKIVPPYSRGFGELVVISDSASAMLVRRSGGQVLPLDFQVADYPEWWNPYDDEKHPIQRLNDILTDRAAEMIGKALDERRLQIEDIALLLPPNLNRAFTRLLSEKVGISGAKVFAENTAKYGCLLTSDLVVNLASALDAGLMKPNDTVIALSFGFGMSLGCLVAQIRAG